MPIPASNIVKVEPRVIGAGRSELEMNGLYISTEDPNYVNPFPNGVREFTSASAVREVYGPMTPETEFATHYFNGYINKFMSPKALYLGVTAHTNTPAWVSGAPFDKTLDSLTTITAGRLHYVLNGTIIGGGPLDLSTATSLSMVAQLVTTALKDVTLTYDGVSNKFVLMSKASGSGVTLSVTEGAGSVSDVGMLLNLTPETGSITSAGMDAETPLETLERIRRNSENWVTFTVDKPWYAQLIEESMLLGDNEETDTPAPYAAESDASITTWGGTFAEWAANHWGYIYVGYGDILSAFTTANPLLPEVQQENTVLVYGSAEYAAFIMGSVASIDWTRANGAITLAFKRGDGLASTVNSEAVAAELESRNVNFYGAYATRNADFDFLYPGRLLNSDYVFIDPLVNAIWLNNSLQVSSMNGLTTAPRVPYTDAGFTRIRSWMMDPVNRALTNGVIEPGVTLSESQKSELAAEAGADISEELFTQGYYIQILDPGAPARVNRETPSISLWYTYGGAVQRITVASTVVL